MRQVGVLFAVVAAAALAGTALAGAESSLPAKNTLLGGGAIGAHFVSRPAAGHPDVKYTTIRVDKTTGSSLHLYAEWPVTCTNRTPVTAIFDTVAALRADGTFGASGVLPKTELIPQGLHYSFSGAFDSPTAAHVLGSARFRFAQDGKTSSCAGTGIRTQVRAVTTSSGAPAPARNGVYYGSTSDTGSVILRVAADGRHVAQIGEEGWLDCKTAGLKKNGGPFLQNTSPPLAIKPNGTFGGRETFDSTRELLPGTVAHMTSSVSGKFGAGTVAGTWELRAVVVDQETKKVTDTCTRKVTWTAAR